MSNRWCCRVSAPWLLMLWFCLVGPTAQAADTKPSGAVDLALKQGRVADRYRQLEVLMLKMAEYDASNNPRRAALLRQAIARGKQKQISTQMDAVVQLLQGEQLQQAVDGQGAIQIDLKTLLDLLLSEDRPDRLKNEQARIRDYIKQLDRIIRLQRSVQGRTEGGAPPKQLSGDQGKVAERAGTLGDEIDKNEGTPTEGEETEGNPSDDDPESGDPKSGDPKSGDPKSGDPKSGDPKSGDPKSGDPKSGDPKSGDPKSGDPESGDPKSGDPKSGDPKSGDPKSGDPKSGDPESGDPKSGDPNSGEPSGGQPNAGQPNSGQPNSNEPQEAQPQAFPGRQRIAAAEDRMRQAEEQLKAAKRDDAVEKQEEARRLLEQAKAELEEILRQLREEEIERVLALLEGRFRRMLEMELKIQDGTVRLSKTPAAKRTRQFTIRAGKLSLDQRKVVLEVDKALTLLREEGSSVAFPEAAEQIRSDMEDVAELLVEEKVGSLTQGIEADIITALEEMIAALQKAQQEAEERKANQNQQPPGQQGAPGDQPLVNQIAELKMIRALQMRVNTRTQRFAKMLADVADPVGQATDDDLLQRLRGLAAKQQRIYDVTSDIVLGKNK